MKKTLAILALLMCTLLLAAGCGGSQEQAAVEKEKVFVFGDTTFNPENGEPDLDPHNDNGGWACIRYGVGETLFHYSDKMEVEPWLATKFENIDPLTWKITLREGVQFSNGKALDAAAVKACLEHLVAVHKRAAGDLKLASIEGEGQELTIKTRQPVPTLPNYLSDPYGCIVDVSAGNAGGITVGTGPYKAVEAVPGSHVELVKNANYWGEAPKLDRIRVRTITDGDTLTMALQSGEIDAAYGLPYSSYPLFDNEGYVRSSTPTSRVFYITMNYESELVRDPAVRKAIAMGIDKDGFVKTLLQGNGYTAAGVFPDTFSFGNKSVHAEGYDPEGARQVLEAAGWKDTDGDGIREKEGKKLTLRWLSYPSRQELPLLAESAQATLGAIGFEVQADVTADHNTKKKNPEGWDVYVSAMVTAPTGDPAYFFTYHCLDASDDNVGRYHSDKLEALARQMEGSFDLAERGRLATEMQQAILDDHAFVFCSHLRMSMIAKATVKGLTAHPCDFYEITAALDKD